MTTSIAILLTTLFAVGADGEDSFAGKTTSQWVKLLRSSKQVKARQAAVTALEAIGAREPGVLSALTDALAKDPDPAVRQNVAQALGRMGEDAKSTVEALGHAVREDKSAQVREAAALALGGRMVPYSKRAVLVLAEALRDPEPGPRQAAAKALKDLGDEARPALPQIIEVLRDRKVDRFTRTYAVQLVSRLGMGGDAAVQLLAATFAEKEGPASVRIAAAEALGRTGAAAEPAVPILAAGLKSGAVDIRRAAAAALVKIGPPSAAAWPAVKTALGDDDSAVRAAAIRLAGLVGKQQPEVVPLLTKIAQRDANVEARLAAIQELGQLGKAANDAAAALTRLAGTDTRASIREAAEAALKKIQGPR